MTTNKQFSFRIIISIILCELVGNIPTPLTIGSINTWYQALRKPFFNPPNWIFGPVWTVLFMLMGISLAIAWSRKAKLHWFWIQLILNVIWSLLFFGLQSPLVAFFEIMILWFTILMTIRNFWKVSHTAAYLLIPYLMWVTFAATLNFALLILN